jgi:hypothetical protein
MTERQEYYLGITLSYIAGAILTIPFLVILTIPFLVFIGVVRAFTCVLGVVYDTFMFTPRVVMAFQYRHWEKQMESNSKNAHLN